MQYLKNKIRESSVLDTFDFFVIFFVQILLLFDGFIQAEEIQGMFLDDEVSQGNMMEDHSDSKVCVAYFDCWHIVM